MNVAIYGKSGSGKTTVCRYLAEQHGFTHCHPGARCRDLSMELFGTDAKSVLNRLSDSLRAIDEEVWIRAALRSARPSVPVVFDGIRFRNDFRYFRARSFLLWQVRAPQRSRHDRLETRGQEFSSADEDHEGENVLDDFPFDVVLDNNGDQSHLFAQIDIAIAGTYGPP